MLADDAPPPSPLLSLPNRWLLLFSQSTGPYAYALKLVFREFDKQNKHVTKATLISARTHTNTPINPDPKLESMAMRTGRGAQCTSFTASIQRAHSKASTTHSLNVGITWDRVTPAYYLHII